MRLPEDVENVLKTRGEKAAVRRLCRQHKMTRAAATAWVSACYARHLPAAERRLANGKIVALLTAAFLAGMVLAALEKLF